MPSKVKNSGRRVDPARFKQMLFIFLAGILSLAGVGVTVFFAVSQDSYDTRQYASEIPVYQIASESLVNGERISVVVRDNNSAHTGIKFELRRYDGLVKSVVVWRTAGSDYFSYDTGVLDPSSSKYYVKIDPVPSGQAMPTLKTQDYAVESPTGKLLIDDRFCSSGFVSFNVANTNRSYFKVVVSNIAGGTPWVGYFTLGSLPFPTFTPKANNSYGVKLYSCHQSGANCETLIDQADCYAVSCNAKNGGWACGMTLIDLGVSNLSVPTTIFEGSQINTSITVRNYSQMNSGPFTMRLSICSSPTCATKPYETKTYVISGIGIAAGGTYTKSVTFSSRAIGTYVVYAVVTVSAGDINLKNNSATSSVINVVKRVICLDVMCPDGQHKDANCQCVDCLEDSHCPNRKVCDLESKKCVCDTNACPPERKPSTDCSSCVCKTTCGANEWQDSDCVCHPKTCTKVCGAKQILLPNCTCKNVECKKDSDCSGYKVCDEKTYKCVCDLNCGTGMQPNSSCSACVCSTSCPVGKTQRADCSCVPSGTGVITDPSAVDIVIDSPEDESSFLVGDKGILRYVINGNYNIDPLRIEWFVDETSVGSENNVSYTFEKKGDLTITLKYNDVEKDSITVHVLDEKITDKTSQSSTTGSSLWELVKKNCWIGLGILLLIIIVIVLAIYQAKQDKDLHERNKNNPNE